MPILQIALSATLSNSALVPDVVLTRGRVHFRAWLPVCLWWTASEQSRPGESFVFARDRKQQGLTALT